MIAIISRGIVKDYIEEDCVREFILNCRAYFYHYGSNLNYLNSDSPLAISAVLSEEVSLSHIRHIFNKQYPDLAIRRADIYIENLETVSRILKYVDDLEDRFYSQDELEKGYKK